MREPLQFRVRVQLGDLLAHFFSQVYVDGYDQLQHFSCSTYTFGFGLDNKSEKARIRQCWHPKNKEIIFVGTVWGHQNMIGGRARGRPHGSTICLCEKQSSVHLCGSSPFPPVDGVAPHISYTRLPSVGVLHVSFVMLYLLVRQNYDIWIRWIW